MRKFRNIFFYVVIIGSFSLLMYWIIQKGKVLEFGRNIHLADQGKSQWMEFLNSFVQSFGHPLAILLAQIITIIIVSRIFGWIFIKIGQPTVIGEIVAGIVLGPSLIGLYFPEFFNALFPVQSLGNLQLLSMIGLILFMFVIGMELDLKVLKSRANEAVIVSHASIIIPFALGMGLAYFIYPSFAPKNISFEAFSLFIGISVSITAFPVLSRIVQERGINKTKLGTIVITCAAADDITAWSLLAAVIALAKAGSFLSALPTILMAIGYVLVIFKIIRPFLKKVGDLHASRETLSKPVVALFFLTLILSAYLTEIIGIHALFGAFIAGAIMPDNQNFKRIFIEKVEDVALVLLLPLFFVFTGLRTHVGLLNDPYLWKVCGFVILVAITGKFAGSAMAAKFVGQSWHSSLTIGALMNTRGLVELVALNIGYDLGILTPEIFTMLVIMALVTTFMTAPALHFIDKFFGEKQTSTTRVLEEMRKFKILISFGKPEMGRSLLRLSECLTRKQNGNTTVSVLHLCHNNLLNDYNRDEYETESFGPVIQESEILNQKITTLFKATDDIDNDIAEIANKGDFDLLLIGIGQSIFEGSLLGKILGYTTRIVNPDRIIQKVSGKEKLFSNSPFDDRTQNILSNARVPVGIFIDKNKGSCEQILVPVYTGKDGFLIDYIQRLIKNAQAQVTVTDPLGLIRKNTEIKEAIRAIEQEAPNHISLNYNVNIDEQFIQQFQLMLISTHGWEKLVESKKVWLNQLPSILILRN
jgi:Kef-type K+ transport system membrane component KefB